jgi:sugar/nucleoside kinase (ribokinase family)
MGIVVIGAVFVDIKGHPLMQYIPTGRNVGRVLQVHGGVARNIAEDIANVELRPTFVSVVDESGIGEDVVNKLRNHKVNVDYIRKVKDGQFTGGIYQYGLAESGVGYVYDKNNERLIPPAVHARLEQLRREIVAGRIVVPSTR